MKRRDFLRWTGFGATLAAAGACGTSGTPGATKEPARPGGWTDSPARHRLRIPPQLAVGAAPAELSLRTGSTEFVAGRTTPTWGVNGTYLGPTLRMTRGEPAALRVRNGLPETTSLHWHGLHLPARMDGGPHQPIAAGGVWGPRWEVGNAASTAWYHPHPHGQTASHVFRGVAGLIVVDDPGDVAASQLPRDYGVDDIPVILQDRTIDADGQVVWDTVPTFGQMGERMLVNGTLDAFVDVTTRRVRLRLLNASNARLYNVCFADGRRFTLVAADQGVLPAPVDLTRLALGPAERAEIVVECAPGERVVMGTASGPETIDEGDFALLELRAAASLRDSPAVPADLGGAGPLAPPAQARARTFRLQGHDAINDRGMDMTRIDEVVPAGAVEIWELENNVYSHNFHIHGVDFSILDRDGRPPHAWETGRKDTVHVPEKSRVRLAVRFPQFTDPSSPYMYHCHILRHEDAGMMGQFVVVEPGTESSVSHTLDTRGGAHAAHSGRH